MKSPDKSKTSQTKSLTLSGPRVTTEDAFGGKARRRAPNPNESEAVLPEFAAQVLGGGERRGLKGGEGTLKTAKSSYLQSEFSGPNDRRPKPGMVKKTDI